MKCLALSITEMTKTRDVTGQVCNDYLLFTRYLALIVIFYNFFTTKH